MQGICVSVPTDDGKIVKLGHFGDAKYYYHYAKGADGKWILKRIVGNPYAGQHEHGDSEEESTKRPRIYELNKDCTCIVATAFGPGGQQFMERRGLQVVKVKPRTTIEEALSLINEFCTQA